MRSRARKSFWRLYNQLGNLQQQAAREAYRRFLENPDHSSLKFKKLQGFDNYWSVRINDQFRAVGKREGDVISWFWIGSHNDFDKLFRN